MVLNALCTSLVIARNVQEARQASASPTSPPEGPTSTASSRASSSYPPRVPPLLARQLLFLVCFYCCAVRLPVGPRVVVHQRQSPGRRPQDRSRTPAPARTGRPLPPERTATQLSVCRLWEVTSQSGGGRKLRECQGRSFVDFCVCFHNKRKVKALNGFSVQTLKAQRKYLQISFLFIAQTCKHFLLHLRKYI